MNSQPREITRPCRQCGDAQKHSVDLCESCAAQEREAQDDDRAQRYVEAIRTANLTPAERRASLSRIAERRALLIAELAQLDAMRQGHLQALGAQDHD